MSMQTTIGFDFGTHQTKICVEEKAGGIPQYHFFTFKDRKGQEQYMLPSVVRINPNRKLSYGFIDDNYGTVVRYFKQGSFCTDDFQWTNPIRADYFSIWYLAYVLFHLESQFGTVFTTQMGAPTDTAHLDVNKRRAVSLMGSAFHLVEEIYHNDRDKFLDATIDELLEATIIKDYSPILKKNYDILVFPEAFACLSPIIHSKRITSGMSLIMDVGGGTTDISFFTYTGLDIQIYKFISIPKGLNYLTDVDGDAAAISNNSNVQESQIIEARRKRYTEIVDSKLKDLKRQIDVLYNNVAPGRRAYLDIALSNRPLVYAGGGSTFSKLCKGYSVFSDVRQVTTAEWNMTCFPGFDQLNLSSILNTAYGLSISRNTDDIQITPMESLFRTLEQVTAPKEVVSERSKLINKNYIPYEKVDFIDCKRKRNTFYTEYVEPPKEEKKNEVVKIRIDHSESDIDNFLKEYYQLNIPISDELIHYYSENISDKKLRTAFIHRCWDWNEEYEKEQILRARQKEQDKLVVVRIQKPQISLEELLKPFTPDQLLFEIRAERERIAGQKDLDNKYGFDEEPARPKASATSKPKSTNQTIDVNDSDALAAAFAKSGNLKVSQKKK